MEPGPSARFVFQPASFERRYEVGAGIDWSDTRSLGAHVHENASGRTLRIALGRARIHLSYLVLPFWYDARSHEDVQKDQERLRRWSRDN